MSLTATAVVTVLGAGCAAATLWLAHRAEQASPPSAGPDAGVTPAGGAADRAAAGGADRAGAADGVAAGGADGVAAGGADGAAAAGAAAGAADGGAAGAVAGEGAAAEDVRWWEAEPWWDALSADERVWVVRNLADAGHAPAPDLD